MKLQPHFKYTNVYFIEIMFKQYLTYYNWEACRNPQPNVSLSAL